MALWTIDSVDEIVHNMLYGKSKHILYLCLNFCFKCVITHYLIVLLNRERTELIHREIQL